MGISFEIIGALYIACLYHYHSTRGISVGTIVYTNDTLRREKENPSELEPIKVLRKTLPGHLLLTA